MSSDPMLLTSALSWMASARMSPPRTISAAMSMIISDGDMAFRPRAWQTTALAGRTLSLDLQEGKGSTMYLGEEGLWCRPTRPPLKPRGFVVLPSATG